MTVESVARKIEPEPPAKPPEPERLKEITIDLGSPVQAFGNTLTKLTFRRPTGGDLMSLGEAYPVHIDFQTGDVRPVPIAMGQIMSTLAQVPVSTIRSMDSEDFSTCAHALIRFFVPGAQAMRF